MVNILMIGLTESGGTMEFHQKIVGIPYRSGGPKEFDLDVSG